MVYRRQGAQQKGRMPHDPHLAERMRSEEDRRRALAAGFDHHLVMPVDRARLEGVLAAARQA